MWQLNFFKFFSKFKFLSFKYFLDFFINFFYIVFSFSQKNVIIKCFSSQFCCHHKTLASTKKFIRNCFISKFCLLLNFVALFSSTFCLLHKKCNHNFLSSYFYWQFLLVVKYLLVTTVITVTSVTNVTTVTTVSSVTSVTIVANVTTVTTFTSFGR